MEDTTLKLREGFLGQKMIVLPEDVKKELRNNPLTHGFHITDIGYYPKAKNHYRKRKNGAKDYIFIYCTEGQGIVHSGEIKKEIGPNQFIIIAKNTGHGYWAHQRDPWSIYWLHFNGSLTQKLYSRYLRSDYNDHKIPFDKNKISQFNQIYQIMDQEYAPSSLEFANILGLKFISSFVYTEIEQLYGAHHQDDLVNRIIEYLTENLDKSLETDQIAQKFNYSASHLSGLFKKRTGYSMIHFFNFKKAQKSCEFLTYTDLSIKEVSYQLGFDDPLYFSRVFKKYMGISPRAYKKEQNKP